MSNIYTYGVWRGNMEIGFFVPKPHKIIELYYKIESIKLIIIYKAIVLYSIKKIQILSLPKTNIKLQ